MAALSRTGSYPLAVARLAPAWSPSDMSAYSTEARNSGLKVPIRRRESNLHVVVAQLKQMVCQLPS